MEDKGPKFNETDVYRVRKNSRLNQGVFLCKVIMKKHGSVQVEGMGECISLVTKISQILTKNGFANLKNLKSENVEREDSKSINPKLSIKLEKSDKFEELTSNITIKSWFVRCQIYIIFTTSIWLIKYNKTICMHTYLKQQKDVKKLNECIESYENKLDQQVNEVVSHVSTRLFRWWTIHIKLTISPCQKSLKKRSCLMGKPPNQHTDPTENKNLNPSPTASFTVLAPTMPRPY